MNVTATTTTTATAIFYTSAGSWDDDGNAAASGVREPIRPHPPVLSAGAEVEPDECAA